MSSHLCHADLAGCFFRDRIGQRWGLDHFSIPSFFWWKLFAHVLNGVPHWLFIQKGAFSYPCIPNRQDHTLSLSQLDYLNVGSDFLERSRLAQQPCSMQTVRVTFWDSFRLNYFCHGGLRDFISSCPKDFGFASDCSLSGMFPSLLLIGFPASFLCLTMSFGNPRLGNGDPVSGFESLVWSSRQRW